MNKVGFIAIVVVAALLAFTAGTLLPSGTMHFKHMRDLPERLSDGSSMMVAVIGNIDADGVHIVACPSDARQGPAFYTVSDPDFVSRGFTSGQYVPVYYMRRGDEYQFLGWADNEEN